MQKRDIEERRAESGEREQGDTMNSPRQSNDEPLPQQIGDNIQEAVGGAVGRAEQEVARTHLPWYRSARRITILMIIYIVQLALFGLLAWWVHIHPVLGIDVTITREFQENQSAWLRDSMYAVSWLGFQPILFTAMIIVTAVIFWLVRLRLEAVFVLAVCLVSSLLNGLIKLIVARPRPTSNLVDILYKVGGQSFPSGHVMSYLTYFGLLFSFGIILFKRDRWWHYLFLIIPAAFVVLVGPSRIYLGDHWATDVLGGYLFGGILLEIALYIYLKLKERGVLSKPLRHHKNK